jgi:hypothetical protein
VLGTITPMFVACLWAKYKANPDVSLCFHRLGVYDLFRGSGEGQYPEPHLQKKLEPLGTLISGALKSAITFLAFAIFVM